MKNTTPRSDEGSTIVVVLSVTATLLVFLGAAVEYSQTISRQADRSRKTALAMEIADGHLEVLFSSWRNIYRSTWTTSSNNAGGTDYSILPGNYFFTSMYNPGPAPVPITGMVPAAVPPTLPTPDPANFSSGANYTLTQYRIQAVDPMVKLDASENSQVESSFGSGNYSALSPAAIPPAAYGPNTWQYSYFYLAAADVTVPALKGSVTAKVRRIFEKKFDNPWSYAMFYTDDLEFQPTTAFTINGPVHTNGSLYIGTSNFNAGSTVAYAGDYVNGFSPLDTVHSPPVTAPNFAKSDPALTLSDMPPSQVSAYLPFGWNVKLSTAAGSGTNNDTYHELIERPGTGTDQLATIRMYNQAAYRVVIDSDNSMTITDNFGNAITTSGTTKNAYNAITGAITVDQAIQDQREGKYVRLTTVDVAKLKTALDAGTLPVVSATPSGGGWPIGNVIYFSDKTTDGNSVSSKIAGVTSVNTTERAFRLINGYAMPNNGLTVVCENPVYIQGNYNAATTSTATIPSNNGTYTTPTASGYTRKYAAVYADAITVLSGAWSDANSTSSISSRGASNTTVNAAFVTGNVPTVSGSYSGGGENFIRLLEDWKNNTFCYYGSLVQLFASVQGTGKWTGSGNTYKAPITTKLYWDTNFGNGAPPGRLQIAAYLQQQRWYQVY